MSRLTDAQIRCLGEILQNAYDAGGNDARKGVHRRTFGERQLSHMASILNDADRFEALESRDKTSEINRLGEQLERVIWDAEASCLLVYMSGGGECVALTPGMPVGALTGRLSELVQRIHTNCSRRAGGPPFRWTTQKDAAGFTLAYSWEGAESQTNDGVKGEGNG